MEESVNSPIMTQPKSSYPSLSPPLPAMTSIVFILRFNLCVVLYTASYVEAR